MGVDISLYVYWTLFASFFFPNVLCEEENMLGETGNVTNTQSKVFCGKGRSARKCSQCPFDGDGNYHGGIRCYGDCSWMNNECRKGDHDIQGYSSGLDRAFVDIQF